MHKPLTLYHGPWLLLFGLILACQDQVTYKRPTRTAKAVVEETANDDSQGPVEEADNSLDQEVAAEEEKANENQNMTGEAPPVATSATGQVMLSTMIQAPVAAGRYAPDRLQAIWISDQNNQHLRTLDANPGRRPQHLRQWRAANGDQVDGFSGATIVSFAETPTSFTWDLKDKNGNQVVFGDYKIWFEMTQSNTNAAFVDGDPGYSVYSVSFSVKPEGFTVTDNNHPSFTNINLTHTP